MDNQGSAEPVRVLPLVMGMIPKSPSGICLRIVSIILNHHAMVLAQSVTLTVKLYVKVAPGGMGHWLTPDGPSIVFVPV